MAVLQLGLILGGIAFAGVSWASWTAGYGPEVAVVRGLVAFMAASLVAYAGAVVVVTAPPLSSRHSAGMPQPQPALPPGAGAPGGAEDAERPAGETGVAVRKPAGDSAPAQRRAA